MNISAEKKIVARFEMKHKQRQLPQAIEITDNFEIRFCRSGKVYKPELTPAQLHADNNLVRLIMGPYRSGKSVALCAEIIFRACAMPECGDGIRRCRVAIIRNTYADLQDTVLRTWLDWYGQIGEVEHQKHPRIHYRYIFNDGKGLVDLELLFLAIDNELKDARKLRSLEVTFAYVNEFAELPFGFLSHIVGRTGCYPPPIMCSIPYWHGVFLDSNAPNLRHPIRQVFEIERPDGFSFYRQPPAVLKSGSAYVMNPAAENVKNLPANYYLDLIKGATDEFIKVFAMGDYGSVFTGKFVYPQYNDNLNSVDKLEILPKAPLVIGLDFGLYSPAALVVQERAGQLRCIKEFVTHDLSTRELVEVVVMPYLRKYFDGYTMDVIRDPAGSVGDVAILNEIGLPSNVAATNDLNPRIDSVHWFLNRMAGGEPALLIDRQGCPTLREGFLGGYNYKRVPVIGDEKYRDVPDKNFYSHIHDCLQYCALFVRGLEKKLPLYDDPIKLYNYNLLDRDKVTGY